MQDFPSVPSDDLPASLEGAAVRVGALPASAMRVPATAVAAAARPAAVPAAVDVAIVGAGVIGLSIAWRLARAGSRSRCSSAAGRARARASPRPACWRRPPSSSRASRSCWRSRSRASGMWPPFRAGARSGLRHRHRLPRRTEFSSVALGRDEVERLRFRHDLQRRASLATQWLDGAQVRDLEPGLRPSVAAGTLLPRRSSGRSAARDGGAPCRGVGERRAHVRALCRSTRSISPAGASLGS